MIYLNGFTAGFRGAIKNIPDEKKEKTNIITLKNGG
jgi:hypothetical protein